MSLQRQTRRHVGLIKVYMLFTGCEVRMGENRTESREPFHDRGPVFPHPDRAQPVNNVFIFFPGKTIIFSEENNPGGNVHA